MLRMGDLLTKELTGGCSTILVKQNCHGHRNCGLYAHPLHQLLRGSRLAWKLGAGFGWSLALNSFYILVTPHCRDLEKTTEDMARLACAQWFVMLCSCYHSVSVY